MKKLIEEKLEEIKEIAFESAQEARDICDGWRCYVWMFENGYIESYVETLAYPSEGICLTQFNSGHNLTDRQIKKEIDEQLEYLLYSLDEF
ncbi:hypothetical protein P5E48_10560 [Clostridium perfringens]|uniref:hypothetical protein n=1 Tax=Clostridium perfringens TaxID=1502 RepID=UPI0024BC803B|nr:hypothetical protein [Clostridium perfringens]EIF6158334.1 hypothetical protein [Clostridium perfringens]MDK0565415.1 hypothetical protein [Clostridium perfringens]MDK0793694.1 hypothetical protein [Clostridium perfringens]MDM0537738.1 hypothetical protein [Clostridium perfringens]MDU4471442.1 hypothetical protein [Clostridium perfringens]